LQEEWIASFDAEGRIPLEKEKELRKRIFYGVLSPCLFLSPNLTLPFLFLLSLLSQLTVVAQGIEPELRQEVWKYLLGYFSFNSTFAEREQLQAAKRYKKTGGEGGER
jgi:hypothetical protein